MSKISDRLAKLGQTERTGLGFGVHSTSVKVPVILVGLRVAKPADAKNTEADLVIVSSGSSGAAQSGNIDGVELWGVAVTGGTGEDIESAAKAGADFVVVEDEAAPGAALKDDDLGRGYAVNADISDDRAKAIDTGPFDFLVLDGSGLKMPMNVGTALDIQEQLARYSRHIFLSVSTVPEKSDLELLRDMGISALIYDSKSLSKKELGSLREAIEQLEPRKQRSNAGAVVPRTGESAPVHEHEHDHDDSEEDDWE